MTLEELRAEAKKLGYRLARENKTNATSPSLLLRKKAYSMRHIR